MNDQVDWLFAASDAAAAQRRQLERVRTRRDQAITRVGDNAGEKWIAEAAQYIRSFAGMIGRGFLIEEVVERWRSAGMPVPHDGRAWGAAARRALLAGWIKRDGYAPAKTSNCSPKVLWRAVS